MLQQRYFDTRRLNSRRSSPQSSCLSLPVDEFVITAAAAGRQLGPWKGERTASASEEGAGNSRGCYRPLDGHGPRKRAGRCAVACDAEHVGAAGRSSGGDHCNQSGGTHPAPKRFEPLVAISNVTVEGGFPELEAETEAVTAKLRGRRVTVAEIFAAANAIEQAYAARGYVLVRVAVPPQQLKNGGPLRLVVVDGFVESVDVKGVPERQRALVQARLASLIGKRHVTLAEIERRLILASDIPGLVLSSTIARGTAPG
jgi:hypothetical protein